MQPTADTDAASSNELLSQDRRYIILQTSLKDALVVERMQGCEALNQDLDFTLDCVSTAPWLGIGSLIGECVCLQIVKPDGELRWWDCVVTEAEHKGHEAGLTRYCVRTGSWLSQLRQRRNTQIFQDQDALDIVGQVFAHYTRAKWTHSVTQPLPKRAICTQYRETDFEFVTRVLSEDGLSFRFEQSDPPQLDQQGNPNGNATLVVFDRRSPAPQGGVLHFARVDATEAEDAVSRFSERVEICSDAAATSRWNPALMSAVSGLAQHDEADPHAPVLPAREVYDAAPPHPFANTDQATLSAQLLLDAVRLYARLFVGEGAVRTLQSGRCYALRDHFSPGDNTFICLSVNHYAVNNLGARLAQALGDERLEAGNYRNSFTAVPATTPIVPSRLPRPLAAGVQTAMVVGNAQQTITSTRDHQVRVQFYWQRGDHPLHGGLHDPGHAPGNESSGTWVRVAEDAAGNNFGQHFTPRIGAEVLIGFTDADIDRPTIIGQLYGGYDTPPFAAGVDASANHPGTLSGMQTRNLDGSPASQWLLDDASGQLRHELNNATADSRLALGYLIEHQGAERGAYAGEGFVNATDGWGQIRAAQGLLISATRRKDAVSTQLDISEAHGQLQAAVDTAERLDLATRQCEAGALNANTPQRALLESLDPKKAAHHPSQVNGQHATQPTGTKRHGGDPVPCFNDPYIVLETPSHLCITTPNSSVAFAGENLHVTTQQDTHLTAGHTIAGVSGDSAQWFTATGGAKVVAQQGDVSFQASSDALEILADQSLTVTATDECIELTAKDRIVLQSGTSSITLQGSDIEFACDGTFKVRGKTHPLLDGEHHEVASRKSPSVLTPLVAAAALPMAWAAARSATADRAEEAPEELEEEEEEVELEQLITLRVGMFFDGTGNNRSNSEKTRGCWARDVNLEEAAEDLKRFCKTQGFDGHGSAPDDSRGNDSSNVAKLYDLYRDDADRPIPVEETEASIRVYVEGIGTSNTSGDSMFSKGTGIGVQGVRSRVEESPGLLLQVLRTFEQNNPERRIEHIQFDVFGFSRGAAAARDFANEALKAKRSILAEALPAGSPILADSFAWRHQTDFSINCIGIFDTVASIASVLHGDFNGNNANNPGINIGLAPDAAKKIVHLVAQDETRYNFSLNRVGDADIVLPGVHSDLGGGYLPNVVERILLSKPRYNDIHPTAPISTATSYRLAEQDLQALRKHYAKYDLPMQIRTWTVEVGRRVKGDDQHQKRVYAAVSLQREVRNELALVYLRIMHELAVRNGVPFEPIDDADERLALPDELVPITEKLMAYALGQTSTHGLTPAEESVLYGRYIHLSSHWNAANGWRNSDLDVVFINRPDDNHLRTVHPNE